MYRTRHLRWKLMHVFGTLSHLGLVVAVGISYIYDLGRTTRLLQWSRRATADVHFCNSITPSPVGTIEAVFTFDMASHILLKACMILGSLGFTTNVLLFASLLAVEPNRITLTEGEQHWRKQIVTFFGCMLNLLLATAGVGLGVTLDIKAADSEPLIAPLICTYIQASAAIATTVCDALKNYREGQDLLD